MWLLPEGTEVRYKKQPWVKKVKINSPAQIKINDIIYTQQVFKDKAKLEELGIRKED